MRISKTIANISLICTAYLSVITVDFVGSKFNFENWNYMVSDSNKILAFLIGVGVFLFFNNIKLKYNKVVNTIAASTFGVLLIHASSDAMRYWLWKKTLNVSSRYTEDLGKLMIHAVLSMCLIFMVCTIIDMVRIKIIERPILNYLSKYRWFNLEL